MSQDHVTSKMVAEQQEEYRARVADGMWPDANVEDRLRLQAEIERLTRERDLWKERHDRERAAHAKNLAEQQKCEAERDRLKAAMRKALNVWHNYRIDSTEEERAVEDECKALVGDSSDETVADSAWLIEMAGPREQPLYWHAVADARCIGGFDPDPAKAMRFCREKDARDMALMLGAKGMIALTDVSRVRITEHEWTPLKAGDEP